VKVVRDGLRAVEGARNVYRAPASRHAVVNGAVARAGAGAYGGLGAGRRSAIILVLSYVSHYIAT
jgi:hypothetical protein